MTADISLNVKVGYQVICRWTSVMQMSANMLANMSTDSQPRVGGNDCRPIISHECWLVCRLSCWSVGHQHLDDTLLILGGLFIWSYIFCMSVQIFLSPLSRQQLLRDFMAALASLMREHDCTECLFDIFLQKNRFLTNISGCLCYEFLWAVIVCSYMSVLINTNHIMQQLTVMPLTVDQYSADTWHLPYWWGVDQYTKISTHTPSTYIINQHLVRHVVRCGSTCWLIGWSSFSIDRQPTYTQPRGA